MRNIISIALAAFATGVFAVFRNALGFGPALISGLFLCYLLWSYIRRLGYKYFSYFMTAAFVLWLISFAAVEYNVVKEWEAPKSVSGDYAIILGAGLKGDKPSVSLDSRLQMAAEYLKQNQDIKVIVSGGQGKDEKISEAEAMKRYLISKGIEEERIIKEDKSTSTRENLLFSKKLLDGLGDSAAQGIIVITSDYHVYRTKAIADSIGMEVSVLSSVTPFYVRLNGSIREYFAVVSTYLIK